MDKADILKRVDHTLLKPTADWNGVRKLCEEAIEYRTASVCVPPCYVRRIREAFGANPAVCVVVGFPLGYSVASAKLEETRAALADGADEVDMVINVTDVKNGRFDQVLEEISLLKKAMGRKILKVIVETCYLTREEKIRMCGIVTRAGADFIKTSTGFGPGGATIGDIELFKAHIGPGVRIKAAGGIKSAADLEMYIEAGCERLGTSQAVALLTGGEAKGY